MRAAVVLVSVAAALALVILAWRTLRPDRSPDAGIRMMNPRDLLFTLPTLADRLPDGSKTAAGRQDAFYLHEDDWRQVEFVGLSQVEAIDAELEQLRNFMSQHRKSIGFTEVSIRKGRPDGLGPLGIESAKFETLIPKGAQRRPLIVGSPPWGPTLVNGYAIDLGSGVTVYAELAQGQVITIGLPLSWLKGTSPEADAFLSLVARTLKLRLVDWPAATWVELG